MQPKIVVADFDDVMCNTSSQWFTYLKHPDPHGVWYRKDWDIFQDDNYKDYGYTHGDCYDKMEINPLGNYLVKKALTGEIILYVLSHNWMDTDASKQRMFDRVFPNQVKGHISSNKSSKGEYIKNELGLSEIDVFIDDKLKNHQELIKHGVLCDHFIAPLAPFTINHYIKSTKGNRPMSHYIPIEFNQEHFKQVLSCLDN